MPHVIDLLELDHLRLAQDLEREHLVALGRLGLGWPDETHAREGACVWGGTGAHHVNSLRSAREGKGRGGEGEGEGRCSSYRFPVSVLCESH